MRIKARKWLTAVLVTSAVAAGSGAASAVTEAAPRARAASVATVTAPVKARLTSYSYTAKRITALRWARWQDGKPYEWGGTGPWGFDCSGLVMEAYRHAGIWLPRTTYEMLSSWRLRREPVRDARPGDLLFYGRGHVELDTRWWHQSYGAEEPGTRVGWHYWNRYWAPTMAYRVAGAG